MHIQVTATGRQCAITECNRIHKSKGLCNIHYLRRRQYGDALHPGVKDRRPWRLRFMDQTRLDARGCLLWTGPIRGNYGAFYLPGRGQVGAHRIAYELSNGSIPDGQMVCHSCDTPLCCLPAHLFLGDAAANNGDMVRKGRNTRGARHPRAKLSEADVLAIRRRYVPHAVTLKELAEEYEVRWETIRNIVKRRIWRSI